MGHTQKCRYQQLPSHGNTSAYKQRFQLAKKYCLQLTEVALLTYLCAGEFLPQSVARGILHKEWATQQVVLLALLSVVLVLIGHVGGVNAHWSTPGSNGSSSWSNRFLVVLNLLPLVTATLATRWHMKSDNCPVVPFDGAPSNSAEDCNLAATLLDVLGLVTARLARFNLALSMLLCNRGHSSWVRMATGGWLGLPEAIALHRASGWWCVGQSAAHSILYLFFYSWAGTTGSMSLWWNCFPTDLPTSNMNRLGLVNFFGLLAFLAMIFLAIPAWPRFKRLKYHIFQRLHLPAAILFLLCCAMHDLAVLTFALPGIADWILAKTEQKQQSSRSLCAKATVLHQTSGPWVELKVDCTGTGQGRGNCPHVPLAPRGEWALVRIPALSMELHPLSVTVTSNEEREYITALVTARAGDWSRGLSILSQANEGEDIEVNLIGPFEVGGGHWSIFEESNLLLVAGGSAIFGFLPAFENMHASHRRVRLIWCVKTETDYHTLAGQLPSKVSGVKVSVYITETAEATGKCIPSRILPDESRQLIFHQETLSDESINSTGHVRGKVWAEIDAFVSLAALTFGLVVIHWGWTEMKQKILSKPETLFLYALVSRLLPILLVLTVVIFITSLGYRLTRKFRNGTQPTIQENVLLTARSLQDSLHVVEEGKSIQDDVTLQDQKQCPQISQILELESASDLDHEIQIGRPDLAALICTAAEQLLDHTHLVVAACGPCTLVQSTGRAATSARMEGHRVAFYATDSRW